jgi:hypothetical protein
MCITSNVKDKGYCRSTLYRLLKIETFLIIIDNKIQIAVNTQRDFILVQCKNLTETNRLLYFGKHVFSNILILAHVSYEKALQIDLKCGTNWTSKCTPACGYGRKFSIVIEMELCQKKYIVTKKNK